MTNLPPAGWYPDQQGSERWWDGTAWTEQVRAFPAAPPESTPAAPAAATVPQTAFTPDAAAPSTRKLWPWFLVGGIVLLLVIVGVVVAVVIGAVVNAVKGPAEAVLLFDSAYATGSCDEYTASTSAAFRESEALASGAEVWTCELFEDFAAEFNSYYSDYEVEVTSTEITNDQAVVESRETYEYEGASEGITGTYHLVMEDGGWRIDTIEWGEVFEN